MPEGVSVVWGATPSNVVSITPNGNSATVTKLKTGFVTLTAALYLDGVHLYDLQTGVDVYPIVTTGVVSFDNLEMLDVTGTAFKILPVVDAWRYRGSLTVSAAGGNIHSWSQVSPDLNDIHWSASGATVNVYSRFEEKMVRLRCTATGPCGNNIPRDYTFVTGDLNIIWIAVFPNPAVGEATISLMQCETDGTTTKPDFAELGFDENTQWDLEVYDQSYQLKVKKTKLKGNEYTLNTSGWKEGIYIVRVNYNGQLLTEKLMVKE